MRSFKMSFRIEGFQNELEKLYPESYSKIWEWMQLSTDKLTEVMKNNIHAKFKESGFDAVLAMRNENTKHIKHFKDRLGDSLPHDDELKIEMAIEFYKIYNSIIYELEPTLRAIKDDGKEKGSNADKLSIASDWMDAFMRKITKPKLPTDDKIKDLFNEIYPGFKLEFDMSSLKTPKFAKGGKLQKTSISEALRFIVLEKHPEIDEVTADAIYRRYKNIGYW